MINDKSNTPLTNRSLIAYGGLAIPISIAEMPIILYLPAFYAKEMGLSIGMVGLVFLLARLWDGFSDPVIGTFSDRTMSRIGRRKPWVIMGAPLLMATTWFLCNPPEGAGLVYLGIWAILFYTAQTVVKIPYWSWGAELSSNYEERSRITGFRESGSMIGNVVVAIAPLVLLSSNPPVKDVLFLISLLIILLIPATTTPLIATIKDHNAPSKPDLNLIRVFKDLLKNGPMVRYLGAMLFLFISTGIINSVAIFLVDIGLGLPGSFFSLFFIQYMVAIISVPMLVKLGNRFDKHIVLTGSFVMMVIYYLIIFTLPMGNYTLIAGLISIAGVGFACTYVFETSILADIVDYDTAITGEERTGTYMATLNLIFKLGLALGVGIAYGFLDIVGFDPAASAHTVNDVLKIRVAGCVLTSILLIPAIFLLWKFPITKKVQRELRRTIEANANNIKQDSEDNGFTKLGNHQESPALSTQSSATVLLPDNG